MACLKKSKFISFGIQSLVKDYLNLMKIILLTVSLISKGKFHRELKKKSPFISMVNLCQNSSLLVTDKVF